MGVAGWAQEGMGAAGESPWPIVSQGCPCVWPHYGWGLRPWLGLERGWQDQQGEPGCRQFGGWDLPPSPPSLGRGNQGLPSWLQSFLPRALFYRFA